MTSSTSMGDSLSFILSTSLKLISIPFVILFLVASFLLLGALKRVIWVKTGLDIYNHIPNIKHTSKWFLFFGDMPEIRRARPTKAHLKWMKELDSPVYVYRGMFYNPRLLLADPVAMNFVLGSAQSYGFPKPQGTRNFLSELLGDGVLTAEGDIHKRQRKLLQPAFSVSAIRDLQPIFFKHGNILAKHLLGLVEGAQGPSSKPFIPGQSSLSSEISEKGKPVMDVSWYLSRTTLDVIGEAAFATDFSSITSKDNNEADTITGAFTSMLNAVFQSGVKAQIQLGLQSLPYPGFSLIRHIPTERRKKLNETFTHVQRISQKIIDEKRDQIRKELNLDEVDSEGKKPSMTKAEIEESSSNASGKDLLYILMKSNLASDIPASEKLSDSELINNFMTILFAGYETTSTLLGWTIWTLAQHIDVQEKLRAELEEIFAGRDELIFDELNNTITLKYLDNVSKEMMRFLSPVTGTIRCAEKDTVIPLSKGYKTRDGKSTFNQVLVKKGQEVIVPISILNTSSHIWGEDAEEFNPDRWNDLDERVKKNGFPNGILTFIEGPRGCIGNRFAIAEFKAILCSLILNLKFESVPGWEIEPKQSVVLKGRIIGQEHLGMQIPVRVSKV